MIKTFFACLIASLAFATAALAAPFGIAMGTPVNQLTVVSTESPNTYKIRVPIPNSEFESYTVIAPPGIGVCKIIAVGRDHTGDHDGMAIRATYSDLKTALASKYGPSKEFDFIKNGALWSGDTEFAMSLRQNERILSSFWTAGYGSALPGDLTGVMIEGHATSASSTYVNIVYEYANFTQCSASANARDNSAL